MYFRYTASTKHFKHWQETIKKITFEYRAELVHIRTKFVGTQCLLIDGYVFESKYNIVTLNHKSYEGAIRSHVIKFKMCHVVKSGKTSFKKCR